MHVTHREQVQPCALAATQQWDDRNLPMELSRHCTIWNTFPNFSILFKFCWLHQVAQKQFFLLRTFPLEAVWLPRPDSPWGHIFDDFGDQHGYHHDGHFKIYEHHQISWTWIYVDDHDDEEWWWLRMVMMMMVVMNATNLNVYVFHVLQNLQNN